MCHELHITLMLVNHYGSQQGFKNNTLIGQSHRLAQQDDVRSVQQKMNKSMVQYKTLTCSKDDY